MTTEPFIRPYRPSDRAALGDICVRTAHAGADASPLYPDPELLPTIFAYPYVELEPDFAFVLDDGTAWLPGVSDRYPAPTGPATTPAEEMTGLLHTPERMVRDELTGFPAHLHIDLLPAWQGRGHGRALIGTLLEALRRHGVPAVHLCMAQANTPARAFYDRLGFRPLAVDDPGPVWYLGRPTTAP